VPHVREFLNAPSRETIVASLDRSGSENYVIEEGGEPAANMLLRDHGFLIDIGVIGGHYAALRMHRVFAQTREDNERTDEFTAH
jgi:hypothetical protein